MAFQVSKAFGFMETALNARAVRQDMISSNIANVDTPNYRPRDISFEDALQKESNKAFGSDNTKKLEMAKTDGSHLNPIDETGGNKSTIFFRDGQMARNDGNSVDLDVETTEMGKNSTMYQALVAAIKKDSALFSAVIDASKSSQ
jgi:flagellar basal-body rod protein FlgB